MTEPMNAARYRECLNLLLCARAFQHMGHHERSFSAIWRLISRIIASAASPRR
jgi:hypothetical protein